MNDPIINFDKIIKINKNTRKQNKRSFPVPSSSILYGIPGAGKTTFIASLILSPVLYIPYDRLMIFASDLQDDKYQLIKEKFEKIEEKLSKKYKQEVKILTMSDKLSDVPIIDTLDRKLTTMVVFDDMIEKANNREHEIVTSYFVRGRRMGCCTFYLTQSYFEIPRVQRTASNYLVLFKINNLFDLKAVHRDVIFDMPLEDFIKMYYDILKDNPHGYVIIDMRQVDPLLKIRGTIAPKKIKNE